MSNPSRDVGNFVADDVNKRERQKEIKAVIKKLSKFKPTKIAVEVNFDRFKELNRKYKRYLEGKYKLKNNEAEQIGFRLAKLMRHSEIYPVDWNKEIDIDFKEIDFMKFAEENNQRELLEKGIKINIKIIKRMQRIQEEKGWIELFRYLNRTDTIRKFHLPYFLIAQIGNGNRYPGANWVQYWYGRNLKIFVNLIRIAKEDDRILLIIGAGHVYLLKRFAIESGFFKVENVLKYLK
jgi:hypothetical protein